jgi:hypothetical protein
MAGNFENRTIYVETDYNNIILVDPNKLAVPITKDNPNGFIDRLVDHEDLVMYANLETKIIPRTKLADGVTFDVINTTIASFSNGDENNDLNFLKPKNKVAFDSSWTDEFTGKDTRNFAGANQKVEYSVKQNGKPQIRSRIDNYEDTQTLGIKNITIKISPAGTPQVDIKMTDVGGRTLFQQGDHSLYSVFFNLPYPAFYLTLKGYYGKAARFQLVLISFNASFDPQKGNFDISLKLTGRLNALLFDTTLGNMRHSTKMYPRTFTVTKKDTSGSSTKQDITTTLGVQVLKEVYSEYHAKKLIQDELWDVVKDDPMTIERLEAKLINYKQNQNNKLQKAEFTLINDIADYRDNIKNMDDVIYKTTLNKYLDLSKVFVFNSGSGEGLVHIPFKNFISKDDRQLIISKLDATILPILEEKLKKNEAFGENAFLKLDKINFTDKVTNKTYSVGGPINITDWNAKKLKELFYKKVDNFKAILSDSDDTKIWIPTYFARFGKNVSTGDPDLEAFKTTEQAIGNALGSEIDPSTGNIIDVPVYFFVYGEKTKIGSGDIVKGTYLDVINNANTELKNKETVIETALAEVLTNWTTKTQEGLGFTPTIRSIFGILMANAETYYRMMDDVHDRAWEKRFNSERLRVIFENKRKQNVEPYEESPNNLSNTNFIYPWPQYYVKETQKDNRELFVIKYIGETDKDDFEKGLNYDTWPEVDFTEEYLARSIQKESEVIGPQNYTNSGTITKFISPNALEFSFNNNPFEELSAASFLYELWERSYLNSHYTNLNRNGVTSYSIDQLYGEFEGENAKLAAEGDLLLPDLLKNNVNSYEDLLREMNKSSRSKWSSFEQDFYVSDYINKYFQKTNQLLSVDTLNVTTKTIDYGNKLSENIDKFLEDTKTNDTTFFTVFPFNDFNWLKSNLANGNSLGSIRDSNQTTKTLTYETSKKIIGSFPTAKNGENKLFVSSTFLQPTTNGVLVDPTISTSPVDTRVTLKQLYINKTNKNIYPTETIYDIGTSYSGALGTSIQTTSIFNTPYFVNAFIEGESLKKSNIKNAYVGLGYLFLNSLPLITLREKIKNIDNNITTDLDYLFATLTKYPAIHQVPYAWVLKYGSIWHRYKKYIETGNDILNNIWKDFDYKKNYDPELSNTTKEYKINNINNQQIDVKLQTSTNVTVPNTYTLDQINLGFYPNVINSVYYFLTNKNIFNSFSSSEVETGIVNKNIKVGINIDSSFKLPLSGDPNNLDRTINVNNLYAFIDSQNNTDFPNGFNGYLILPSTGGIQLNQSEFECIDDQDKLKEEIIDNQSMYNGSVKMLWGAPNYGYFKNVFQKPKFDEYIKIIKPNVSEQSCFDLANTNATYSKIDEIISVLPTDILDIFENKFLDFCNNDITTSSLTLEGEANGSNGTIPNLEQKSLLKQIFSLFSVSNSTDISDEQSAGLNIATNQLSALSGKIKDFISFDCVIKLANPTNFNRKLFDSFSNSNDFKPKNPLSYTTYTKNLPPDLNFQQIQILRNSDADYNDAWVELLKRVGNSEISEISLSNSASTVYDFFKDNKIEFTKNNIENLYQIIKIYATKKKDQPNYTPNLFKLEIEKQLQGAKTLQKSMVNRTLQYLTKNLPSSKVSNISRTPYTGNVLKLNQYSAFKTFNDKWIAGSDFKGKTYFEDFLFQDRANVDIGNDLTIDTDEVERFLKNQDNKTLMDLLSTIISDNQCIFFALPSYINFYGIHSAIRDQKAIPEDIPNSLFGTFLNVDYIESRPRFLITYVGKPSENLSTNDASFVRFGDDAFDIRSVNNPLSIPGENVDLYKSNRVVGFNVDFGILHQNIFSDIELDMSEKKNTAESFKIYEMLGATAAGDTVAQQTVSLYNIYRTRSYTCKVKSMGNALIQPTMYFNLRYIPLFYGPYWITEVSHNISPNDFKTDFTGIRMPLYSLPTPDSFSISVNKKFKENWKKETYKSRKPGDVISTTEYTDLNVSSLNANVSNDCLSVVATRYKNIPFVAVSATTISVNDLANVISAETSNTILASYLFALSQSILPADLGVPPSNNGTTITCQNHNLFDITTLSAWSGNLEIYVTPNSQNCKTIKGRNIPIVAFSGYSDPINFMLSRYANQINFIKELYQKNTDAYILSDPAISGYATTPPAIKQVRLANTLFQLKVYSWDSAKLYLNGNVVGIAPSMTANEVFVNYSTQFRPALNNSSTKAFIEIFIRSVKKYGSENEV